MSSKARMHGRRSGGFTLVELLVVVSIIALLISILLPALRNAREQAKSLKCLAHARGLAQAAIAFANDHNDRFQLVADAVGTAEADPDGTRAARDSAGELLTWPVAVAQMTAKDGFAHNWNWGIRAGSFSEALSRESTISDKFPLATCPADKVKIATPFYPNSNQLLGPGNPLDPQPPGQGLYWGFLSYGINEDLTGAQDASAALPPVGRYDPSDPQKWRAGQRHPNAGKRLHGDLHKVFDPATVLLIADAGADDDAEANIDNATGANTRADGVVNLIISAQATGPLLRHAMDKWPQRIPIRRHAKGQINTIFADFHGSPVRPTKWGKSSADARLEVPTEHSTLVRVSPYRITGPVR